MKNMFHTKPVWWFILVLNERHSFKIWLFVILKKWFVQIITMANLQNTMNYIHKLSGSTTVQYHLRCIIKCPVNEVAQKIQWVQDLWWKNVDFCFHYQNIKYSAYFSMPICPKMEHSKLKFNTNKYVHQNVIYMLLNAAYNIHIKTRNIQY